jgi:hypothetical protein
MIGRYRRTAALAALASLAAVSVSAISVTTPGAAQVGPAHSAPAARTAASEERSPATCIVHSLPSFTAQGEESGEESTAATVADVVEVECNPNVYGTGSKVKITAAQLFSRCEGRLTWYVPNPFAVERDRPGVTLTLDADGNATVALLAGPGCAAGESLVAAHMEDEPFETFTTSFSVLPPHNMTPGVSALPADEVEDALSSSVATIVQVTFAGGSGKRVHITSEELFDRCRRAPHLHLIRMNGEEEETSEAEGIELDNNGSAFVIAIGDGSCAEGPSLIEADLESKPFTTFMTTFTIQPPQPTEEPSFTIEKRQEIAGSGAGPTTAPLTGSIGQTVDYEVLVKNTANVPETFSEFTDGHCDPGTITGGPGSGTVAPGQSTIYRCEHVLSAVGSYTNEASVTGSSTGGIPIRQTSNQVVVTVPPAPSFTIEKSQMISGGAGAFTTAALAGSLGETVDYRIVVRNTGNEALTFSGFTDVHCDSATIAGGPGGAPLAPGSSTTFTCSHVLASVGSYVNEASVTGTPPGESPLTHSSNPVEVNVPAEPVEPGAPGVAPGVIPAAGPGPTPGRGVGAQCEASRPVLHGVSGPKHGIFSVQISSRGAKHVTFYLDGRKLKLLKQAQSKGGRFTIQINPTKLSFGAHKLLIKIVMTNPGCASVARSAVFVHPQQGLAPKLAG